MSLILKAAHQFHRFFPFAQLLTANWMLKRNPTGSLMPRLLDMRFKPGRASTFCFQSREKIGVFHSVPTTLFATSARQP
jgi:hypothetical protein